MNGPLFCVWQLLHLIFDHREDVMSIKLFVETIQRMTVIANNSKATDDVFVYAIDIMEALHHKIRSRNILIPLPDITPAVVTRIEMISKNNMAFTGPRYLAQRTTNIRGRKDYEFERSLDSKCPMPLI